MLLNTLYTVSLVVNIILIPISIYIFFKKRKTLNIPLILQITLIVMMIDLLDIASTIHCFEIYKSVEIEANPYTRFVVGELGYWGFIPLFLLDVLFVFSMSCISFFLLVHFLPRIYEIFPPKTKLDRWVYERRKKVGRISFYVGWIVIITLYISVPFHNWKVC